MEIIIKLIQHYDLKNIELHVQQTFKYTENASVIFKVPMKQIEKVALNHGIDNVLTSHFSILPWFTSLSWPSQRNATLGDTVCLHGYFDFTTQLDNVDNR